MESKPLEAQGPLAARIALAWFLGLVALGSAGLIGRYLATAYGIAPQLRLGVQAAIMSGLVVPGIWLLRRYVDRRPFSGLEMFGVARSIKGFGLGSGLIMLPTILTLLCTLLFGWATLSMNPAPGALARFGVALVTAFFFEALPEELMYRGYIYRNLNTVMRRWTAGLTTIALFTLLPTCLALVQRHVLHMEVQIGGNDHITGGYVLTMVLFGTFLQYLRTLSGTVWAGIGFHLFFLMSNRITGNGRSGLIHISDTTSQAPMQAVLIGGILLSFIAILIYPRISGRSLGWGAVNPE